MPPRIYTEIRISHKTEEEKANFKIKGSIQAAKLGVSFSEYIKMIVELDAATGLIVRLKGRG